VRSVTSAAAVRGRPAQGHRVRLRAAARSGVDTTTLVSCVNVSATWPGSQHHVAAPSVPLSRRGSAGGDPIGAGRLQADQTARRAASRLALALTWP